ncbi:MULTISPECIES: hypothetical protein [unclassified Halanaerobium]|uniref:hypothetical protein n=1 Tax=unclassified Halanaerobium TaxID=2641197 RepID=UPI000DF428F7|nr:MULTISPECIES: hypothetical protein [unclassified Halanaerobium]RCW49833.1 hypothetical protein DFR78_1045 [Halanaerobium sp. MA284_MarDTE_T2]RCW88477.1 hypothetical protein DER71_1035 [Halanaerobium sp. DL-01]
MKSAYEIALERAEKMSDSAEGVNSLEVREEIKPILAEFFRGDIDADDLWEKLKTKNKEELIEAQLMLIESIGLRNTPEQIERRKKGIIAVENLISGEKTSFLEQTFTQAANLQQQYEQQKKQIEKQIKDHMENSQGQMKAVQTADGRTVMKEEPGMDSKTKNQFAQQIANFQKMFTQRFDEIIEDLKSEVKNR